MTTKLEHLQALIEPAVKAFDCELWGIQLSLSKQALLRVYIEAEQGVSVEDCEKVSRQVSGILDVEDPIPGEFTLEVSSPGMDRPLFTQPQFEANVGEQVKLRLRYAFEGRRNFKGLLVGVEGDEIVLQVDNEEYLLPVENIESANIVPNFK